MNVNTKTAVAVLVVAVMFVLIIVPRLMRPRAPEEAVKTVTIEVLQARQDLGSFQRVEQVGPLFMTVTRTVPVEEVSNYVPAEVRKMVNSRVPLFSTRNMVRGEIVKKGDLVPPEQFLQYLIQDHDYEIISFPAESNKVIGGRLWPGQFINIYLYGGAEVIRSEAGEQQISLPQVELIADHVWVVDVRASNGEPTGYGSWPTPADERSRPSGGGIFDFAGGGGQAKGGTIPVGIITVALDHLKARRLVELMGSMGYRAWISLSPKTVATVTPTPSGVKVAAPTLTPICDPWLKLSDTSAPPGVEVTVNGYCDLVRGGARVDLRMGDADLGFLFGDTQGRYEGSFLVPEIAPGRYELEAYHNEKRIGWQAFVVLKPAKATPLVGVGTPGQAPGVATPLVGVATPTRTPTPTPTHTPTPTATPTCDTWPRMTPNFGPVGTAVRLNGYCYEVRGGKRLDIRMGGVQVGFMFTSPDGHYEGSFRVPPLRGDETYEVTVEHAGQVVGRRAFRVEGISPGGGVNLTLPNAGESETATATP